MRFYNFSPEKKAEYKCRIKLVREKSPNTHFPSQAARDLLCVAMGLRYYKAAINMAAELGDTKLCEDIYKENQVYKKVQDIINVKYSSLKDTPLMNAVRRRRLGTAEWLLQHGAKILPNKEGWNPVLWACHQGCIPALNMFKYYGVDFNQPYPRWEWKKGFPKKHFDYPIEVAVVSNHPNAPKVVQWLLNNGVSIDNKKEKGFLSIREVVLQKTGVLTPEIRQILLKKVAQSPTPDQLPKKASFCQRFSFGRIKE